MKFLHKKARVNEDKLYEEKTFDRDYEEDKKRYRKRMKEIEKSRRSFFDMMEEAENDEYFDLENVIGPGYKFCLDNEKDSLKEMIVNIFDKLQRQHYNYKEKLKLDKKDNLGLIGLSTFEGLTFSTILTQLFTNFFINGPSAKSNIIFGMMSFLIIAGIYPVNRIAYIKDMKKIDCTNELLDLNGLYYDAGDEELDIDVIKVRKL